MKKLNLIFSVIAICGIFLMQSCSAPKKVVMEPINRTLVLELSKLPQSNIYINMDYGIRLNVLDKRATPNILNKYDAIANEKLTLNVYPEIKPFVAESMKTYMQTMGFDLNADINTDYLLQVEVTQFQVSRLSGAGWVATVCLDMEIFNSEMKQVYPRTTVTGRDIVNDNTYGATALNNAYVKALENIDWDRVAYFTRKAKSASDEKNKQVSGEGDTALENTVILWYIESAPMGADVFWRIVSSTPDVKNTNLRHLSSTPYESTETFDIKGLTFNNSGNVQIEIQCEKVGYITQRKRFNLRQVIEQKEISTKFNLIEDL